MLTASAGDLFTQTTDQLSRERKMSDGFERLAAPLAALAKERNWTPTPIQVTSQKDILAGRDSLLIAPTGSGKTEAALMPLLSRCLTESWNPLAILYITPLRALNRDIGRRIEELVGRCSLRSDVRHGDTPQSRRSAQSRNPPHLLVTTSETCQLLLTGSRLREGLRNLSAVVIDEVHDLAAGERGAQLSIALERIDELCGRRVQRIGLSATIGNPEDVAHWLSKNCTVCLGPTERPTQLEVTTPKVTPEDRALSMELHASPQGLAALRRLASQVKKSAPCLIFVNSRNTAETVAQRISKLDGDLRVGVHHGSLAAETRREMETALQSGELHGLVCTSSLELGIDVGSIREVHQIQSPRAVDRLLQRVGRAEHHLGGTSKGMLLAWNVDDISESAVIARRAIGGQLEGVEWRTKPLNVVANQLVLLALSEGIVPLSAPATLLARANLFESITDDEVNEILTVLDERRLVRVVKRPIDSEPLEWPTAIWQEARLKDPNMPEKRPKREEVIATDEKKKEEWRSALRAALPRHLEGGWFSPGGRGRNYLINHLSMIVNEKRYTVRDAVTRKALGNVDETFVLSLDSIGGEEDGSQRRFVMAGRTWLIVNADPEKSELMVAPVRDQSSAPVWMGELPPVSAEIAREVGALRETVAADRGWKPALRRLTEHDSHHATEHDSHHATERDSHYATERHSHHATERHSHHATERHSHDSRTGEIAGVVSPPLQADGSASTENRNHARTTDDRSDAPPTENRNHARTTDDRSDAPPTEEGDYGEWAPTVQTFLDSLPAPEPLAAYPLSQNSLGHLLETVADHIDATGSLPTARHLTIEVRKDTLVLNCCHGSRINAALAHLLQAMASTADGKSGRVIIDPYRISLQVPSLTAEGIIHWLMETPPRSLEDIMRMTIPNGRMLRARLVEVCKTFGVIGRGVDPRRVNLQGILNRYRGTVVVDEALDKLFTERMDVSGASQLLEAIQSGAVTISVTAAGPLGISPRSERDLLLPNWSDAEVRKRLEERLMNERCVLICLACNERMRTRVAMYGARHTHCEKCGGTMLAAAREGLEDRLAEWVASNDEATGARMEKNAHLVRQRGIDALTCLMGRGIGEETAGRILARIPADEKELLFKFIHDAELNYARTRQFWG